MDHSEKIQTAFDRNVKAMTLRPSLAQGTAVTRVRVREGMTCDVEDGPWKLVADMSPKHGGNDLGPNPGVLGRAALGTCLAIGYVRWAAKLGVPVTSLAVEVQTDYDARGEFAIADVPAGYTQVRYIVTVVSDAPAEQIERMLDEADAHSSWLDDFRRPLEVRREARISAPAEAR